MNTSSSSEARDRVLDTAERLFMERGYAAVSMRDIAEALQVRPSSLYHHAPQGKEQLFYEAMLRSLQRHSEGMQAVIDAHAPDFRAQFRALAHWARVNLDVGMTRMVQSDLHEVSGPVRQQIWEAFSQRMMGPLMALIEANQAAGRIRPVMPQVLAGALLAVSTWTSALNSDPAMEVVTMQATEQTVTMLLDGCWVEET